MKKSELNSVTADKYAVENQTVDNQTELKMMDQEVGKTSRTSLKAKLRQKILWVILAGVLFLVILAVIIVSALLTRKKDVVLDPDYVSTRIDCLPWLRGKSLTEIKKLCYSNDYFDKCIYQPDESDKNLPACFYDMNKISLKLLSEESTELGMRYLVRAGQAEIRIEFQNLDDATIRFKITDSNSVDYEVPLLDVYKPQAKAKNPKYHVEIGEIDKFNFKIIRKSTGTVLWDSSLGPIIFQKLQRQISTRLPSKNVYGLGENMHTSFKHDMNYRNWPVFARDQIAEDVEYTNLYGSQPFYTCMEEDGQSHGVLLVNSNAFGNN